MSRFLRFPHIAQSRRFIKQYRPNRNPLDGLRQFAYTFHMNPIRFKWKTHLYPATAILAGLVTSQVIATFQVFFANQSLYHTLTALGASGYLTIPNHLTMDRLQELTTAVCGGLFLTLSVGAGISVLSFAAAWLWDRVCRRKVIFLVFLILLWAGLSAGVNWKGFSPFTTLYLIVIPPVVFTGALAWMPHAPKNPQIIKNRPRQNGLWHLIPIIVLGLLWAPQMEKGIFINIRDHLLLSNPVGERIVNFYYQYTLYPAEVLKPLEQKLQKTCNLHEIMTLPEKNELRKALARFDWFHTDNVEDADLFIKTSDGRLLLEDGKNTALQISKDEFLSNPEAALKRFSDLADVHRVFRQLTFYSLLIGFPVTLYIFVYSFFFFFMCRWVPSAAFITAILCFSLAFMAFWQTNRQPMVAPKGLHTALTSNDRREQLRALKRIGKDYLEISRFSGYKTILRSPDTAQRYWLAKAMGVSRSAKTYEDLLVLLKDSSPMVAASALSALTQRREKKAISEILTCIRTSNHWYVQWYAYKALKTLGWTQ